MTLVVVLFFLLGLGAGAILNGERALRLLRTELNSARVNEQLLLTRLASRTPAEFHAITAPIEQIPVDTNRYLYDDTGLVRVVDDGTEDED